MEKEKAWFETVIPNPDPKAHGKAMKILIEGTWDGEKFVGYNDKGFETVVRKEEWIIFQCQHCDNMGTPYLHACPLAEDIEGDDAEICNCCHTCEGHCMDDI